MSLATRIALTCALYGLISSAASPASAEPVPAEGVGAPAKEADRPARFIMGVKFGGGGTLWDQPDETRLSVVNGNPFNVPIFDETRGGYTMSAGVHLEGVFFEHLGLEVGFNFVQHTLLETITWTYTETTIIGGVPSINSFTAESKQDLQWTALHIPVMIKAIVPSGNTRVSLGVGPEFALASWGRSSFEITDGGDSDGQGNTILPGSRGALRRVNNRLQDSVYLAVAFGIQIVVGDFIVPIDIHWGYNLSQPKRYLARVDIDPNTIPTNDNPNVHPSEVTLNTRDTMYGGLRIGFAYQF
jgi:hypothetical protein